VNDITSFARQVSGFTGRLDAVAKTAVDKSALHVTNEIRGRIRSATGGSMRLSGVGKRGARVGARYTVKNHEGSHSALVTAEGPLQLIERNTKAHGEMPKGVGKVTGRKTKESRHAAKQNLYSALFGGGGFAGTKPLRTPYGPRYRVNHPGTKGKHPFEHAVNAAAPKVPVIFQREMRSEMGKAFRGR
jgi:hypothetical protein